MWLVIVTFGIIATIFFYRWATKNHDFFVKRNVPHEKPVFLFGGGTEIIFRKKSIFQVQCEMHNRHEGLLAYGAFDNRDPVLMLRDPQLIKHIFIKDFDHFVNRRIFFDDTENLFSNSLLMMESDKWRDMRSTLSPAFTGSKMRQMFQLILQTVNEAMAYLKEQQQNAVSDAEGFELEKIRSSAGLFVCGIIFLQVFFLPVMTLPNSRPTSTNTTPSFLPPIPLFPISNTVHCIYRGHPLSVSKKKTKKKKKKFREKDNEFYVKAKNAITFTGWQQMKAMIMVFMPKIAKLLKIDIFEKEFIDYFMNLVLDTMKRRKENNIHRPDMIELLMEARGMIPTDTPKTHYREWSDLEVVAQCFVFFFAALEPLSGAMSFAAHELMEYPAVQEKLFEEIQEFEQERQGKSITYELLQKMPYMDMVVSEVLRKWPVTLTVDRTCTKDYVFESAETGERIEIKKGDMVRAGMCAIHRDPKHFDDPDVLNPERFNEENKSSIDSGTYMPFGLGPRNCIGNRFALLETKAFLYNLIRDYRLEPSPKTCLPVVLCTKNVQLRPKNGFWIQFKPRT